MLTDRVIKVARAPADKPVRLWDAGGLYLELSPAGGKLWRWKYRVKGREKRLALGRYPAVSLAEARERREDARRLLARGTDPGEVRATERASESGRDTFERVAREWHESREATLADSHSERVLRALERDVFPYVGGRALDDITPQAWLDVLRRIEARGAVETGHRVRTICMGVYSFARASGRAVTEPLRDLRGALRPVAGRHFPAPTDPASLAPLLRVLDTYKGTLVVKTALLLAPLLFARPGELRSMRWADVDLRAGEWRFVASKTNTPHIVPLSTQARALLRDLRPLTGLGIFVFPSMRSADRCMSDNTLSAALRRLGIDTREELTTHGWRAVARTLLEERLGYRPEVIELQLAHTVRDPLGRAYNRTQHLDERKAMMQAWADCLDGLRAEGGRAHESAR
jgi:integrase